MRRDEFTLEEYRKLHTVGRSWVKKANSTASSWYRTAAYNFMLIMCNTGMRPSEARNLRWRDIVPAKDREGRPIVVLSVRGKSKAHRVVAPGSVMDYLIRVRENVLGETEDERIKRLETGDVRTPSPDAPVFTTVTGESAKSLYKALIEDLLFEAKLLMGPSGIQRSTYCFRHTYATFRLQEGIDVYFLAEQMGTSVKMIEEHYGHVNTVKHADRVLHGMGGWDPVEVEVPDDKKAEGNAKASKAAATRLKAEPSTRKAKRRAAA
jgi:integrase